MALTVTPTPGKQFAPTEKVTIPKLNQLGQPTFTVTGTVGTAEVTNGSITAAKTIADAHFFTSSVSFAAGDYTLTYAPAITIVDGCVIAFKANANGVPNAVTGIRLIIGASTKKLFKNKTETLQKGDLVTNQIIEARYDTAGDGGAGAWQMTSHLSTKPLYYTATVGGTANAITLTITPPASYPFVITDAELEGVPILFKVAAPNTTSCTVNVTVGGAALGVKPLYRNFNTALIEGDLKQDQLAQIVLINSATLGQQIYNLQSPPGNSYFMPPVTGTARNLIITNNTALPNSKLDITCDELILKDTVGRAINVSALNFTVDIDVLSAVFGRDYGGAEANVWHYVWIISTGSATGPLLSQSATAPTMPGTYTYKALVGAVYNNVNFTRFHQAGNVVWINDTNIFTAKLAGVANTYEILAGADLTNFRTAVPPNARSCSGMLGASNTADACRHGISTVNADGSLSAAVVIGEVLMNQNGAAGTLIGSFGACSPFTVPVRGAGNYNLQWMASTAAISTRLNINAFTL